MITWKELRGPRDVSFTARFHHLFALVFILAIASCLGTGCRPTGSKVPTVEYVASLTVNTVALGVAVADEHCAMRARAIYKAGDVDTAIDLATKCAGHYDAARNALMAAAYAVDAWSNAAARGKAVCALNEAATSLSYMVSAMQKSGAWSPPREVTMALAAVAVLAEMVEAKSCPISSPVAAPASAPPSPETPPASDAGVPEGGA
jgi:hypothetical protein